MTSVIIDRARTDRVRTVHRAGVESGRGAPNVDSRVSAELSEYTVLQG
jgi:hypothetical protein